METKAVSFEAILVKVSTLVDGGWRITLDVSEDKTDAVMELSKLRNEVLHVGIVSDQTFSI